MGAAVATEERSAAAPTTYLNSMFAVDVLLDMRYRYYCGSCLWRFELGKPNDGQGWKGATEVSLPTYTVKLRSTVHDHSTQACQKLLAAGRNVPLLCA